MLVSFCTLSAMASATTKAGPISCENSGQPRKRQSQLSQRILAGSIHPRIASVVSFSHSPQCGHFISNSYSGKKSRAINASIFRPAGIELISSAVIVFFSPLKEAGHSLPGFSSLLNLASKHVFRQILYAFFLFAFSLVNPELHLFCD